MFRLRQNVYYSTARSTKLSFPVSGPYPVIEVEGCHVKIATRDGAQRLHMDRVILCPCPQDLPPGVEVVDPKDPPRERRKKKKEKDEDYGVDRLVSHLKDDRGNWLIRVRWAGYTSADDTWEPPENLPSDIVAKYEKRKKISFC